MNEPISFGVWIKQRRKRLDLTQRELAERIGCAAITLRKIELGERRPSIELAERLADHLKLSPAHRNIFLKCARYEVRVDRLSPPDDLPWPVQTEPGNRTYDPAMRADVREAAPPRATISPKPTSITFLVTDIEGSTTLRERSLGELLAPPLHPERILQEEVEAHGGCVFTTSGSTVWAAFSSAPAALAAALTIQRSLHSVDWGTDDPWQVSMVLHTGLAQEHQGTYVGSARNLAAQMLAVCDGEQIVLSVATYQLICDHLPPDVQLCDLGKHYLQDFTYPEHLYQVIAAGVPYNTARLKTTAYSPTNLGPQPTALINRERELTELSELLRKSDVRFLLLTGPGGVGKTRLAIEVATKLLADFADGVFLIQLAAISTPELVGDIIAQTLGVDQIGEQPLDVRLKTFLYGKQLLLLLDNFEQVAAAAPFVAALLEAAPSIKVLVTSRLVLTIYGLFLVTVPPLTIPKPQARLSRDQLLQYWSIRLFHERAKMVKADFDITKANGLAVAEICRRLDGLPLAIELAAARSRFLSPQAMLARLTRRLEVLNGGPTNMPPRQQTLRGTIAWSYELLTAEEQRLFAWLSVFVGGCTLEAVEAVCGSEEDAEADQNPSVVPIPWSPLEGVTILLDNSLIQEQDMANGEPRLVMLETIREYALERLEQSGEAEALRYRHANYYLEQVRAALPELESSRQEWWIDWLKLEHDNLCAALDWLIAHEDAEAALCLSGALGHFWAVRGRLSEGRVYLERALGLVGPQDDGLAQARCRHALGTVLYLSGQCDQALVQLEQAYATCEALGEQREVAAISGWIAVVYKDQGKYARALDWLEQRLRIATSSDNRYEVGIALNNIGLIHHELGNHEQALDCFTQGLAIAREVGKQTLVSKLLCNTGLAYESLGNYARALECFHQFHQLSKRLGFRLGVCVALGNMGEVYLHQGQYAQALAYIQQYLQIAIEIGNLLDAAIALGHLAKIGTRQQRYAEADWFWERCIALLRKLTAPYFLCLCLHDRAEDYTAHQRYAEAATSNSEALDIASQYGVKDVQFHAHLLAIRLQVLLGHIDRAEAIAALEQMRQEWTSSQEQAAIAYTLWYLDRSQESYRRAASEGYRALFRGAPNAEYSQRYTELTGRYLPNPPSPPDLPELVKLEPIDIDELLKRVDLLIAR